MSGLRIILEKYPEEIKDRLIAFIKLGKTYGRVERRDVWRILQLQGVQEQVKEEVRFYEKTEGDRLKKLKCSRREGLSFQE